MDRMHPGSDGLAPVLQRAHVLSLLGRGVHQAPNALLHVLHERVVLPEQLFGGEANHLHVRLEDAHLRHELLVVVVLGIIDDWYSHGAHP